MTEKKKKTLIKLAVVLGVIVVVACIVLSGILDSTHARIRVINHADDDFKAVQMDCYTTGNTDGHFIARVSKSGKITSFQNAHAPIPYGTKIDLNPQFRKGIELGDSITVKFCVDGVYMSNTPLDIPYIKGRRPVFILTGNKKEGYELTYTEKTVNWLIG